MTIKQQLIEFLEKHPERVDMSTWYDEDTGKMCVAGTTYMLLHGEDALAEEVENGIDIDSIDSTAQEALGLPDTMLFYPFRWPAEWKERYAGTTRLSYSGATADVMIPAIKDLVKE